MRGPKLNGRILPGGADWQIIRGDGAADVQARYTIESDTGARSWSTARASGTAHRRCWRGWPGATASTRRSIISAPCMRFETGDPALDWLNRVLAMARGQREARRVRLDVYEVE